MTHIDRLDAIEARRDRVLGFAEAMSPEELGRPLREGKWSVLEIVDHLVAAEEDVFQDPARLSELPDQPRGPRHRLMYWVIMLHMLDVHLTRHARQIGRARGAAASGAAR